MQNCIFSAHCTESFCDRSCPIFVETSYLLERNNLSMKSDVFHAKLEDINKCVRVLSAANEGLKYFKCDDTLKWSDLITYCAICQNWKGSRLHCTVYNLKYSKYIDELKNSWSNNTNTETLDYMKIWSESAKVLIISNFDYVNFGDFESQTMLNLIQSRASNHLTTIVVGPITDIVIKTASLNTFPLVLKKKLNQCLYRDDMTGGNS